MADVYRKDDRFYCAKQTAYDTIRNTAGVANLSAIDACKHKSFTAAANRARIAAGEKEAGAFLGYMDRTLPGRNSGTASVVLPLFSASGAGVAPDFGPILESAFGKETVVAGTSVTYGPSGAAKYLDEAAPVTCELWGFNAAGVRATCAYGALVNRLRISGGQDYAELAADFICRYVLSQDRFVNAATLEKGGLTAWPDEPATQTYTGAEMRGFTGAFTFDGVVYTTLRSFAITMNWNRAYRVDKFDDDGSEFFLHSPYELMPEFLLDFSLWSSDLAALTTAIQKINNRTPVDAAVVLGSVPGGIYTIPLKNLIIPEGNDDPVHEDGDDRKAISYTGLRAKATAVTARDEISLIAT